MEVAAMELEPTTSQDEEIHDRVLKIFKSEDRRGVAVYSVEEVWEQVGEEYGMSKEEARFTYDRVRWSRAKLLEP